MDGWILDKRWDNNIVKAEIQRYENMANRGNVSFVWHSQDYFHETFCLARRLWDRYHWEYSGGSTPWNSSCAAEIVVQELRYDHHHPAGTFKSRNRFSVLHRLWFTWHVILTDWMCEHFYDLSWWIKMGYGKYSVQLHRYTCQLSDLSQAGMSLWGWRGLCISVHGGFNEGTLWSGDKRFFFKFGWCGIQGDLGITSRYWVTSLIRDCLNNLVVFLTRPHLQVCSLLLSKHVTVLRIFGCAAWTWYTLICHDGSTGQGTFSPQRHFVHMLTFHLIIKVIAFFFLPTLEWIGHPHLFIGNKSILRAIWSSKQNHYLLCRCICWPCLP